MLSQRSVDHKCPPGLPDPDPHIHVWASLALDAQLRWRLWNARSEDGPLDIPFRRNKKDAEQNVLNPSAQAFC